MTITLGWWAIPTAITLAVLVYGFIPRNRGYYGFDVAAMLYCFGGIIVSLVAWLIWALLT